MIQSIHQGLLAEGIQVPLTKLCAWFGVPRRTVYYRPTKAVPKVDPRFAEPIKAIIEQEPSFGYRTVAWLLGFNKTEVAADLSAQRLAGPQASRWHAPAHRGDPVRCQSPERALVDRHVPGLGRAGWMGHAGPGH